MVGGEDAGERVGLELARRIKTEKARTIPSVPEVVGRRGPPWQTQVSKMGLIIV